MKVNGIMTGSCAKFTENMFPRRKIDIEEVINYIQKSSMESKIYIGCDSETFMKKEKCYARYCTVVVIHINGCNGGKVFYDISEELNYDTRKQRPKNRLLNEAIKSVELFQKLENYINGRHVEIHLDINTNEKFASSQIAQQAIGYILGNCGIKPKLKPHGFAATSVADKFV